VASQTFVCPTCGRTTNVVPRMIATDSRSLQEAERQLPEQPIAAPPACTDGHPPTEMRSSARTSNRGS
jgi:hypothetical protein